MVNHAERPAELPVLVADRVEAVRARGDDRPLSHPVPVERLHVPRREDLEHVVIAHPPRRIARARLLLAEDREPDARSVEARRHGAGDALVALVERRRAADPVEDLQLVETAGRGGQRGDRRDLEREAAGPVGAGRGRLAPRVALPLHAPERAGELRGKARLLEDQVPPQPHDLVDVLDQDGAGLHAGAARHAVPDRVIRDGVVDDRLRHLGLSRGPLRPGRTSRGRSGCSGSDRGRAPPPPTSPGCP